MSIDSALEKTKKKRKGKKTLNRIAFDDEVVPKSIAGQFATESEANATDTFKKQFFQNDEHTLPLKLSDSTNASHNEFPKRKKKKKTIETTSNQNAEEDTHDEVMEEQSNEQTKHEDPANPAAKQGESKRSQKRKKHQQLLQEKKVKVDLVLQQKALNYLSQWKHNHSEWKFEKLRQIWLHQNMFYSDRIPDNLWETLIEYFNNAKGKIRNAILDEASKIIDTYQQDEPKEQDEANSNDTVTNDNVTDNKVKMERARSILQYMQE